MNIILNEQAFNVLKQIEQTNTLPTLDTGGVFFDGESYCWVGYKVLNGNFETDTFDTHEEALKFVIR